MVLVSVFSSLAHSGLDSPVTATLRFLLFLRYIYVLLKQEGMNILSQTTLHSSESVFIEHNNMEKINSLQALMRNPNSSEIKKHFFGAESGTQLDIRRITSSQINKHQRALSYRNRNLLKAVLKKGQEGDGKMLQESGTMSSDSHERFHQYFTFHDEIDFSGYAS